MIPYNKDIAEQTEFPMGGLPPVTYEQFVCKLVKEMVSSDSNLIHMALGIAGEAGELVDAIKKHVIYGKPLDWENVTEELGDLEFYMTGLRQMLGLSRAHVLANNVSKLQFRYGDSYSDAAAIARADKSLAAEATYTPGQAINLPNPITGNSE